MMKPATMLKRAPSEWHAIAERMTPAQRQEVEQECLYLAQRAALLGVYVATRYNTGCGDQGHDSGAQASNRATVKVRKALGYSYPDSMPVRIL